MTPALTHADSVALLAAGKFDFTAPPIHITEPRSGSDGPDVTFAGTFVAADAGQMAGPPDQTGERAQFFSRSNP